jgi:hypothetical protein
MIGAICSTSDIVYGGIGSKSTVWLLLMKAVLSRSGYETCLDRLMSGVGASLDHQVGSRQLIPIMQIESLTYAVLKEHSYGVGLFS